jgi:hypothetical protein
MHAQELEGYLEYRPVVANTPARLFVRLARLDVPPSAVSDIENLMFEQPKSLPALDIVVNELQLRGKKLGRAEVEAVNLPAGPRAIGEWRLNRLNLTVPEAQLSARPPTQPVAASPTVGSQCSAPLQKTPSWHAASLAVNTQAPTRSSHASAVQDLASSHTTAEPATHPTPLMHDSAPLQKEPSSQAASFGTCAHASDASSHASSVQPTESAHSTALPWTQPPIGSHDSAPLQNAPSSQAESLGTKMHAS